jgi:hypothetical protein
MLASILSKLDEGMQNEFMNEITELVKSKAAGVDIELTAKDILDGAPEPENNSKAHDEAKEKAFTEASKKYGQSGPGGSYGGINVQEM